MTPLHDPLTLDGREFLHGTSASCVVSIAVEGFRVRDEAHHKWIGRVLGRGLYVTKALSVALRFSEGQAGGYSPHVLRVELAPGTRIARVDAEPDPRALDSLRREFGHAVLGPDFAAAIPHNKRLQPRQLFTLLAHQSGVDKPPLHGPAQQRSVRNWLARLKYHGFGYTGNCLGVLILDPSRVRLRAIARCPDGRTLVPAQPSEVATAARADLRERSKVLEDCLRVPWGISPSEAEDERAEIQRRTQLLSAYCARYGLAAGD